MAMYGALLLIIFVIAGSCQGTQVDRPRGVSLTKKVFYDSAKDFTCFDGSKTLPFSQVNDDYCDCTDGSDEPGTSACPNGQFHCTNAGFRPLNIPSSRVNDGICDCCDGTDEWKHEGLCPDTCKELWRMAREDLVKQAAAASKGVEIRKEYSDKGIAVKNANQNKIEILKTQVEEIKQREDELKLKKDEAETAETSVKEKEQSAWNDFKSKVREQQESRRAADAFSEMDQNKDGSISVEELQVHEELDKNVEDGAFTEDEVRAILGDETVEAPGFIEVIWKDISETYVSRAPESTDKESTEQPDIDEDHDELDDDDDDDDLDDDDDYRDDEDDDEVVEYQDDLGDADDHEEEGNEGEPETKETPPEQHEVEEPKEELPEINLPAEPVWTGDAKLVIDAANLARQEYDDNQKKKSEMEKEISSIEKILNMDFGPDQSFFELHGKCFEFETHEYTYKHCPFDRVVQKPKNGGSETSLGRWKAWNGPEDNKYTSMKYTNGLKCWNGPDRSAEVKISCGDENKLFSASEPSRCEYRFEFATPAACEQIHVPDKPHDEL